MKTRVAVLLAVFLGLLAQVAWAKEPAIYSFTEDGITVRVFMGEPCASQETRAAIANELSEDPDQYARAEVLHEGKTIKACAYGDVNARIVCVATEIGTHADFNMDKFAEEKRL